MTQVSNDWFYPESRHVSRTLALLKLFFLGCALQAEEPATTLAPIQVTAFREADSLINTPTAVTAYEGDFLKDNGITGFRELASIVPGFFVSDQAPDTVSLNIRGVTSDTSDPNVQPRVSVFQDGVQLLNEHGNSVALFDLDNVAVFKGPQPTQFGQGVQSGAVSLNSNRAVNESSGALTLGGGSYNATNAEGYINRPIIDNELFARVAVFVNQRDGYIKNTADGSDLQGQGTVAFRTSLHWQPTTETTADLILTCQHDDTPGIDFKSAVIPTPSGDTDPYTAADLTRGSSLGVTRTLAGLTGIVRHELNDAWTVTSTSAVRRVNSEDNFDADGSSLYLLEIDEHFHDTQINQGLRFDYDRGEKLTASLGGNFSREEGRQVTTIGTDENLLYNFFTGLAPPPGLNSRYSERAQTDAGTTAFDLFGRTDYKVTDKFTLGGGLRVTQEEITSDYQSFAAAPAGNLGGFLSTSSAGGNDFFRSTNGRLSTSGDAQSWEGQVDARYAFTPRFTSYVSVSRGRHPPVVNFDLATLQPERLNEETIWNYEAGVKGTSENHRIRYDASVFQYYYDHFQTQRIVGGTSQTFDGGRARGQGFETTIQADVSRELMVFGTYGFTDAKFAALDGEGQPQAYGGDTFRLTARHAFSLGATLSLPAPDGGTIFFTPLYTYRSAYYFEDDNSQNGGTLRQGGFGLVNVRLGYRARKDRWEIVGYVNNAFDKNYLLDAGNIGGGFGVPTFIPAAPRTVGVQVTVRF